jgi:hypothetical protein
MLICWHHSLPANRSLPASPKPGDFLAPQDQIIDLAIPDGLNCIPADIPASKFCLAGLSVVREDPLLAIGILEIPDIEGGVVAADDGRIATAGSMVIPDSKQRF